MLTAEQRFALSGKVHTARDCGCDDCLLILAVEAEFREMNAALRQAYEALRIGLTACERYSRVYGWAGHDRDIDTMRDAFREVGRLLGKNGKVEPGADAKGASDAGN